MQGVPRLLASIVDAGVSFHVHRHAIFIPNIGPNSKPSAKNLLIPGHLMIEF